MESQIETWVTKLCRCTLLPGAMEPGRIPHTVVGDVAFPSFLEEISKDACHLSLQTLKGSQCSWGSVWHSFCQIPGQSNETWEGWVTGYGCIPCNCLTTSTGKRRQRLRKEAWRESWSIPTVLARGSLIQGESLAIMSCHQTLDSWPSRTGHNVTCNHILPPNNYEIVHICCRDIGLESKRI